MDKRASRIIDVVFGIVGLTFDILAVTGIAPIATGGLSLAISIYRMTRENEEEN